MKTYIYSAVLALVALLTSCSTRDEFSSSPIENYDALWRTLDERYAYFDLKLPEGTTWADLYAKHRSKVGADINNDSLFKVMTALMSELKDGHLNLLTTFDYGRYWAWHEEHPRNFSEELVERYLGTDYHIAGGLKYRMLEYNAHAQSKVGYIRYASFMSGISSSNIDAALSRLKDCRALIIDIRHNPGGNLSYSDLLVRHFVKDPITVGYTRYKTGRGHKDFSPLTEIRIDTLTAGVRWLRPVVLLTNRSVYSSANDFTLRMKHLPYVTVMGDKTGGGAGLPLSSELPNGWGLRYSSTQTLDAEKRHVEFGIEPHYYTSLTDEDRAAGRDTMIEAAIAYLNQRFALLERTRRWEK